MKGHADLIAMEGGEDRVNKTRELEPDLNKKLELKESHSLLSIARYDRMDRREGRRGSGFAYE